MLPQDSDSLVHWRMIRKLIELYDEGGGVNEAIKAVISEHLMLILK